jgi:hypothetical protein
MVGRGTSVPSTITISVIGRLSQEDKAVDNELCVNEGAAAAELPIGQEAGFRFLFERSEDCSLRFASSCKLINEVLNGSIGFVIGSLNFRRGLGVGCWWMMEQAVGQGAADTLVEKDEQGGHARSLFGEAVGVVLAHSLQQAVAFHFA